MAHDAPENGLGVAGQESEMKKEFAKLSKVEQEKVELEYHRTQPEEFDDLLASAANRRRLLEAISDVESDRNVVVPDQEQFQ